MAWSAQGLNLGLCKTSQHFCVNCKHNLTQIKEQNTMYGLDKTLYQVQKHTKNIDDPHIHTCEHDVRSQS